MTVSQKQKILAMRENGGKYSVIAAEFGLSENTVKSICRRNTLVASANPDTDFCLQCGKPLVCIPKKKQKKFCSDKCRMAWWNVHPEAMSRKAVYKFVCVQCGADFESYGDADRKFCSRACYGLSRRTRNE